MSHTRPLYSFTSLEEALNRTARRLAASDPGFPERRNEETPLEFWERMVSYLAKISMEDPAAQLDADLAAALLRYVTAAAGNLEGAANDHPQVSDPDLPFTVDAGILPLARELWTRDYHTISSCQSVRSAGGWAEITFDRPADAQRMVAVCVAAADAWGDDEFFQRVCGDTTRGGKYRGFDTWSVMATIASHTIFSSGVPGLHPFMVSIHLPPSDIELAARAVAEFSGYKADRWAAL